MTFLQAILWLLTVNMTVTVEKQPYEAPASTVFPDTQSVQYWDGQNFWPCVVWREGTICQKGGSEYVIYVP